MLNKYDFSGWMLLRNIYWNEYNVGWKQIDDYKIENMGEFEEKDIWSSNDYIVGNPLFLETMLKYFPDKSIYEFYNINENNMQAKSNYNVTIAGVVYTKGNIYEINPWINEEHPLWWKFFEILGKPNKKEVEIEVKSEPVEQTTTEEIEQPSEVETKQSEAQSEYNITELVEKLKEKKVFVMKNWKDATIIKKAKEAGIIS